MGFTAELKESERTAHSMMRHFTKGKNRQQEEQITGTDNGKR